jgi:hypothetical protein
MEIMEILYLSPIGKKSIKNTDGEIIKYDFEDIATVIVEGIRTESPNFNVTMITDIVDKDPSGDFGHSDVESFDIVLCDLTTMNPNILYHAGQIESWDKPVIYFLSNDAEYPTTLSSKRIIKYSKASLKNEFKDELIHLISLSKTNPISLKEKPKKSDSKPKVFISYSHQNRAYIDRLMVHLKPLTKKGLLDIWEDTKIKTGDRWQEEIEKALSEASIAILMVSADFMASDFIIDNELPPLLSKADVNGTKILPVVVSPCRFAREPILSRFQAANSPSEPLSSMSEDEREKVYDLISHDIERSLENA